jgi:threonine/homoserine/homoserine lactone efflux protein
VRIRVGGETEFEVAKPGRAFLTALGGTASNPTTIVSWGAIFAATSTAGLVHTTAAAVLLVAGVAIGSLTWVTILASGVAFARRSVSAGAVQVTDAVAGAALIGFGGVLAYSTLVAPAGIEPARTV